VERGQISAKQPAVPEIEEPIDLFQEDSPCEVTDDEDDVIELVPSQKSPWPPLRTARKRTLPESSVEIVDVSDYRDCVTTHEDYEPVILYDQLRALRRTVSS
jgi:hypothetical protein